MFLKKAIYVNWGNIPQLEFEFGPINLFSGGNGSGKTTAADGIQTLMTAAHENLFNYNPGQDETTQRGRGGKQVRTLASYVLGCDDGSYARTGVTDGYLAAVFHPTSGEQAEPFTAVMGIRAHLDSAGNQRQARLDELRFIIVPGRSLDLNHFVREFTDGKHVTPVDQLAELLVLEYDKSCVEVYDKKGAYLRRLYGLLRGRQESLSDREAKHAAHTFSNFMAYKPVRNINQFVADEILEKKDLGDAIRTVSDLMKTIHGMEQDSRFIRESLATLGNASELSNRYIHDWIERSVMEYQEAQRLSQLQQQTYVAGKQKQMQLRQEIEGKNTRIAVNEDRQEAIHQQLIALEAKRQGISALREKDELQQQLDREQENLQQQAQPLLEQDQQLKQNLAASQKLQEQMARYSFGADLPALEDKALRVVARDVVQQNSQVAINLPALLGKDWVDTSPLEQHLDDAIAVQQLHNRWVALWQNEDSSGVSLRDKLAQLKNDYLARSQQKQRQLQQKEKEIDILSAQKVMYPGYVEQALQAIREQCPKADPRVLCDYVEVTDPQWQMAIEGYLGGARFSILVSQEYEAQAISIVRNLAGQRNKARVIQGSKAQKDAARISVQNDAIVQLMEFGHKTAEYYLCASYGSVKQVPDAQALRQTARGLTREGLASGNYSMFRCDMPDSDLVFGQGARQRALAAKQKEYQELLQQAQQLKEQADAAADLFSTVNQLKPVSYASIIEAMVASQRQLKRLEQELGQLDLSDFDNIEQEVAELKARNQQLNQETKQLENEKGGLQQELKTIDKQVVFLADQQESSEHKADEQERALREIAREYSAFDVTTRLFEADKNLKVDDHSFYKDESLRLEKELGQLSAQLSQAVVQHNQHCHSSDTILYDPDFNEIHQFSFFKRICQLQAEVDNIRNRLQNNVLVEKHEQLALLKERFNDTFVSHLCHSIYQAINEGERSLEDLNRELEHHRFGTDQERFYFGWHWVSEFKEYWRFLKAVSSMPNLGDGVSLFDQEMPKAVAQVRDKLISMLLDDDEQKAFRELQRIADYRNYRSYEIFKEPLGKAPIPLSQYGTGSGGQLETPAYIIRSAAVASAFRFNEGNSHLRMVLVDEAFSKMDEVRSREVINYLTETLGLQLVFIMPTSKSGPFMDLISNQFVFSKCPSAQPVGELKTRVLVDRKQCNQARIVELWAQHRASIRDQVTLDFMEGIG